MITLYHLRSFTAIVNRFKLVDRKKIVSRNAILADNSALNAISDYECSVLKAGCV